MLWLHALNAKENWVPRFNHSQNKRKLSVSYDYGLIG